MKFTQSETKSTSSSLSHGWHQAYILRIEEEPKPAAFTKSKHENIWRWYCAIWEKGANIAVDNPEEQSAISSPVLSPPRKGADGQAIPASKAWKWIEGLLDRPLGKNENPEIPEPFPCYVKVEREDGKSFVRLTDFRVWPDPPKDLPVLIAILAGGEQKSSSDDDDLPY